MRARLSAAVCLLLVVAAGCRHRCLRDPAPVPANVRIPPAAVPLAPVPQGRVGEPFRGDPQPFPLPNGPAP